MKTSFYFVLWILIYPLLGMLHNDFIDRNSFIVALMVVWGISWLLNRAMPNTLAYENRRSLSPILEDIYRGDVKEFLRGVRRNVLVEGVTGLYFSIATVVVVIGALQGGLDDWVALAIFAFFAFGTISRSVKMANAYNSLKADPTPQRCEQIARGLFHLNYASYSRSRERYDDHDDYLPERPRFFTGFQIFSLLMALASLFLGLYFVVTSVMAVVVNGTFLTSAFAGMYFLYGSLAAYFGVRDTLSIIRSFKTK